MTLDVERFDAALRAGRLEGLALEIHAAGLPMRATADLFTDYAIYLRDAGRTGDADLVHAALDSVLGVLGGRLNPKLVAGFEAALRGGTLVGFAQALHGAGLKKQEITDRFVEFTFLLRGAKLDADEERVDEVVDLLCGWCDAAARLFPDEPDAE